jgi:lysozyme family protein
MLQEPSRRFHRYAHLMWQLLLPLQETRHDGAIGRDNIAAIEWALRDPRLWHRKYDGTSALLQQGYGTVHNLLLSREQRRRNCSLRHRNNHV